MNKTNVVLLTESGMLKELVSERLSVHHDIDLVLVPDKCTRWKRDLSGSPPHVIFADLETFDCWEADLVSEMQLEFPLAKVISLVADYNQAYILHQLSKGIHGMALKTASSQELGKAAKEVRKFEIYCDMPCLRALWIEMATNKHVLRKNPHELGLNDQQLKALAWRVQGKSNEQIGRILNKSTRTVEGYFSAIRDYLEAKNNMHMVYRALQVGLIGLK